VVLVALAPKKMPRLDDLQRWERAPNAQRGVGAERGIGTTNGQRPRSLVQRQAEAARSAGHQVEAVLATRARLRASAATEDARVAQQLQQRSALERADAALARQQELERIQLAVAIPIVKGAVNTTLDGSGEGTA
jgi:hypothetical protein